MSRIRATLWDLGGVLYESPFEAFARYERERGLPEGFIRRLNATNADANAWARLERGEIDPATFVELFEAEARAAGGVLDGWEVLGLLRGELRAEMVAAVRRCRAAGLRTGALTNTIALPAGDAASAGSDGPAGVGGPGRGEGPGRGKGAGAAGGDGPAGVGGPGRGEGPGRGKEAGGGRDDGPGPAGSDGPAGVTGPGRGEGPAGGETDAGGRRPRPGEAAGPRAELDGLFDVVVESSRVGLRKPDPRIYELACDLLGVAPAEVVFLDDLGVNLKPARALGMTTIKVTDPTTALSELESILGIPLR